MQYFSRRILPYAVAIGLVGLIAAGVACSRPENTANPSRPNWETGERVKGTLDCRRSPYPDFEKRVGSALREQLQGIRQQGDPNYTGMDVVITGPPAGGQEKIVTYNIGLKRPLTEAENNALNNALRGVCPQ